MRQLTPPTNLVLALALAAALVAALGLPWYAIVDPAGGADREIEGTGATIARWFGDSGVTVTGADALARAEVILMALAGATAALAMLMALPPLRRFVSDVLKLVPMAAPVVVLVQIVNPPAGLEIRYGCLAALVAALLMANSAFHGAELRLGASSARRRRPAGGPAGPPGAR